MSVRENRMQINNNNNNYDNNSQENQPSAIILVSIASTFRNLVQPGLAASGSPIRIILLLPLMAALYLAKVPPSQIP